MKANLTLAVYCRVSSDEQKTGGNIHRQIEQASEEIKRLGILSEGTSLYKRVDSSSLSDQYFVDEAYNLEEIREGTAFFDLLQLCRDGVVNSIYVDSIDRIFRARSHSVRGQIMDLLEEHGVEIYTPSGHMNNSLVLQFMSAIGAEDKKQILRKLHIGKKYKVQNNGRPPNGRAFWGYDFDKVTNTWRIVEEEARVIRWAVAMASGNTTQDMPMTLKLAVEQHSMSVSDKDVILSLELAGVNLLEYFKRSNLRSAQQKNPLGKLPRNWLTNIYRDDRYTGQHIYKLKPVAHVGKKQSRESDREQIVVNIPPIVNVEEWTLAKASRRGRACVTPRHAVQEYLLQGIVSCGLCGNTMGARARHNSYYQVSKKSVHKDIAKYYVCQTKTSGLREACGHRKHHSSASIDKVVWDRVEHYLKTDVIDRIHLQKQSDKLLNDEIERVNQDIAKIKDNLKDMDSERSKLVQMLGKGLLTEEDWYIQQTRMEKDKAAFLKSLAGMERTVKLNRSKIAEKATRENPLEKFKTVIGTKLSYENKKSIAFAILEKVLIYPDQNVQIILKV